MKKEPSIGLYFLFFYERKSMTSFFQNFHDHVIVSAFFLALWLIKATNTQIAVHTIRHYTKADNSLNRNVFLPLVAAYILPSLRAVTPACAA